jgi:hypothetical protein
MFLTLQALVLDLTDLTFRGCHEFVVMVDPILDVLVNTKRHIYEEKSIFKFLMITNFSISSKVTWDSQMIKSM